MTNDEARARLASAMHALRVDAGMSTTRLAHRLGWSQSKVSKTERGVTLPPPDDVAAWADATGADKTIQVSLVELAERLTHQAVEWRRELAPGRRRKQEEIRRLEATASVIRVFSPGIVVGLAQSRPYVEAVFRLGRQVGPPDESLADVVAARVARQAALQDETKQFYLLMGEAALRRKLISPHAMRDQVLHLVELSRQPNVTIGVIPFNANERVHQYHGFAVLGEPSADHEALVLAETVTRGLTIRAAAEIAEYIDHFNMLRVAALEGEQARIFLLQLIKDFSDT